MPKDTQKTDAQKTDVKFKVGDVVRVSKRNLKIILNPQKQIIVRKDGATFLLWKESINYIDLLDQEFDIVVKKIILLGGKETYICRLALLEK